MTTTFYKNQCFNFYILRWLNNYTIIHKKFYELNKLAYLILNALKNV